MPDTPMPGSLAAETARRRTFAIISHPDAGKTTLTEKLLLYSGAIRTAGSVSIPPATRIFRRTPTACSSRRTAP